MKSYDVTRLPSMITLGYDGENNWRPNSFDCSSLLANHPNGVTGKGVAERYNIPRCSLGHNAARYSYFTIEMLKDQITQCASAHGWLIITTHVNEWGSSLDGDNRLKEVIQHALSNGCVFKTFAEAFEDRRALFTLNEIL